MKSKTLAAALTVVIVILSVTSITIYSQFGGLQSRVSMLETQNVQLNTQNNTLQAQIEDLQAQNQEDLSEFTYQLALERHLNVEITQAYWNKGWHPLGGVAVSHPVNATIHNNDVIPLCGLTATFRFVDRDSGAQIGEAGTFKVDRVNVGESLVVNGSAYTTLNENMDDGTANAICKITIATGDVVLVELTQQSG
jgi:hypothetical protein